MLRGTYKRPFNRPNRRRVTSQLNRAAGRALHSLWKEGKMVTFKKFVSLLRVCSRPPAEACIPRHRGVYWLSMARRWLREVESIS